MSDIDGQWECVTRSPMGDQKSTLTLVSAPDGSVSGSNAGLLGSVEISDGRFADGKLSFAMAITAPLPMRLTCEASIAGDAMTGSVTAGAFGSYPMHATRRV